MRQIKTVTVLGSTGSVGTNTLNVISSARDEFSVFALVAHQNIKLLVEQCAQFKPRYVVLREEAFVPDLMSQLSGCEVDAEVLFGIEGIHYVATHPEVDIVMSAISGSAGLEPTFFAVNSGKRVLLANKESMVMAGELLNSAAVKSGATLLPVDSEHNAVFQCIGGSQIEDSCTRDIEKIILTASGGPFLTKNLSELKYITPQQAIKHPNWEMGAKISVDSATMANKGLELIEAQQFFGVRSELLDVVIHPQSIIHSFVEFTDGAVLSQMGIPDMRIPISYCLAHPRRLRLNQSRLKLTELNTLEFLDVDLARFPILKLARGCLDEGGVSSVFFNAANEVAVGSFLVNEIGFLDIYPIVASVMDELEQYHIQTIDDVLEVDAIARRKAKICVAAIAGRVGYS
jgi:1-deoxy-D-xylulose-5-phosphate reductoisomerase